MCLFFSNGCLVMCSGHPIPKFPLTSLFSMFMVFHVNLSSHSKFKRFKLLFICLKWHQLHLLVVPGLKGMQRLNRLSRWNSMPTLSLPREREPLPKQVRSPKRKGPSITNTFSLTWETTCRTLSSWMFTRRLSIVVTSRV